MSSVWVRASVSFCLCLYSFSSLGANTHTHSFLFLLFISFSFTLFSVILPPSLHLFHSFCCGCSKSCARSLASLVFFEFLIRFVIAPFLIAFTFRFFERVRILTYSLSHISFGLRPRLPSLSLGVGAVYATLSLSTRTFYNMTFLCLVLDSLEMNKRKKERKEEMNDNKLHINTKGSDMRPHLSVHFVNVLCAAVECVRATKCAFL